MKAKTIRLANSQGWMCHWCRMKMTKEGGAAKLSATLDHIEPRRSGPGQSERLAVAAHRICNSERGHMKTVHDETKERVRKGLNFLLRHPKLLEKAMNP